MSGDPVAERLAVADLLFSKLYAVIKDDRLASGAKYHAMQGFVEQYRLNPHRIQSMHTEFTDCKKKLKTAETENDQLKKQLIDCERNENEIQILTAEKSALEVKVFKTENDMENLKKQLTISETKKNEAQALIALKHALEAQVGDLNKQLDKAKATIKDNANKIETLSTAVKKASDELTRQVNETEDVKKQHTKDKQMCEIKIEKLTAENADLNATKKASEDKVQQLTQQVNELSVARQEAENVSKQRAKGEQMCESEIKELTTNLNAAKKASEDQIQRLTQQIKELREQAAESKNAITDYDKNEKKCEDTIRRLNGEKDAAQKALETQILKTGGLMDEVKDLQKEKEYLTTQLTDAKKNRKRVEKNLMHQRTKIDSSDNRSMNSQSSLAIPICPLPKRIHQRHDWKPSF